MSLGFLAGYLDGRGGPPWLLPPLWWAVRVATFPSQLLIAFFQPHSPESVWLFVLQAGSLLGSCVIVWSALAWVVLWLWGAILRER